MTNIVTVLSGAAFLLAAVPAGAQQAEPEVMVRQRVIATGDLDLYSAAGRLTLDRRIASAARIVCRDDASPTSRILDTRCHKAAMASAHRQRDRLFAARGLLGEFRSAEVTR